MANNTKDTIEREKIDYLVCQSCGLVFADRTNPKNPLHCPICAATAERFRSYRPDAAIVGASATRE